MKVPRTLKEIWAIIKEAEPIERMMSVIAILGFTAAFCVKDYYEVLLWLVILVYAFIVIIMRVQIKHLKDALLKEFEKRVTMLDVASNVISTNCNCTKRYNCNKCEAIKQEVQQEVQQEIPQENKEERDK